MTLPCYKAGDTASLWSVRSWKIHENLTKTCLLSIPAAEPPCITGICSAGRISWCIASCTGGCVHIVCVMIAAKLPDWGSCQISKLIQHSLAFIFTVKKKIKKMSRATFPPVTFSASPETSKHLSLLCRHRTLHWVLNLNSQRTKAQQCHCLQPDRNPQPSEGGLHWHFSTIISTVLQQGLTVDSEPGQFPQSFFAYL